MTVQVDDRKVISPGNGSAVSFPFTPIVIFEETDLAVYHYDADGVETLLELGPADGQYQVDVDEYPGTGEVAFIDANGDALANGEGLIIKRVLPLEQQTDLGNQRAYDAGVVETALDRGIMIDLQQQEEIDRSIKVNFGTDLGTFDLNAPAPIESYVLAVNAAGTGFEWVATAGQSIVDDAEAAQAAAEAAQAAAEAAQALAEAAADAVPVPVDPDDDGKFLQADGGVYVLAAATPGGDVVGPASSGANSVPLYSDTTGKLLKAGVALGTSGHPLVSAGAGSPPAFGQVPTAGVADLAITTGKVAANAITPAKMSRTGTAGQFLLSGGPSADPAYATVAIGSGDITDGTNLGSGGAGIADIFKIKSGTNLTFRRFKVGACTVTNPNGFSGLSPSGHTATLTITENTNDITLTLAIVLNTFESGGGGGGGE